MRPDPEVPGRGQESVWDYPRPPAVVASDRRVRIVCSGVTVVDTRRALRVLETSHPPTWYVPQAVLRGARLERAAGISWCEFKGRAVYWDVVVDGAAGAVGACRSAAWSYPDPSPAYETLDDHFTVYPDRVDACFVDDEQVGTQAGGFYGGWITNDVVGPFKGEPGTKGW